MKKRVKKYNRSTISGQWGGRPVGLKDSGVNRTTANVIATDCIVYKAGLRTSAGINPSTTDIVQHPTDWAFVSNPANAYTAAGAIDRRRKKSILGPTVDH